MEKVMVSNLPALGIAGHFHTPDDIEAILGFGYQDHEVLLDTDGKAYTMYDGIFQPLFQFFLFGTSVNAGSDYVEKIKPLLKTSPVEIAQSLHDTPFVENQLTRDNYYVHYKEGMWDDISARRKRRVDETLGSKTHIVQLQDVTLRGLYNDAFVAYRKFGTLDFLDFFAMVRNSSVRDFNVLALVDDVSRETLAVACFSRNDVYNEIPVFGFNQYLPVKEGNWASTLLLKSGQYLAEKYGDIMVDTCYACSFIQDKRYEYKKLVSNLALPVHSLLIKAKGVGEFTPPYLEVNIDGE